MLTRIIQERCARRSSTATSWAAGIPSADIEEKAGEAGRYDDLREGSSTG
jgi:hypothetical protein